MKSVATKRPTNLLEALCLATGVQGGTIHQYDMKRLRWVCDRRPNVARNDAGEYSLIYTDDDGAEWELGFKHGSSMKAVRAEPIDAYTWASWWETAIPWNRAALDKLRERSRPGP